MNLEQKRVARWIALVLVAVAGVACERVAAAVELADFEGKLHRPLEKSSARADAVIFVLHDCPIANAFAPEINRLVREFEPRGVRFFVVQVDPDLSTEAARAHARDYGYVCPVLLDRAHALVTRLRATVTPEAFLVEPEGKVLYRGRIDDRFVELGKRRQEPTRRDLREAIEAVLAGKPVVEPATKAVGCFIPSLKRKTP